MFGEIIHLVFQAFARAFALILSEGKDKESDVSNGLDDMLVWSMMH